MRKVRVLSIDGGGIRGILPGVILERLEHKLQQQSGNATARLADYFDFMAGTSTGGILTLSYLIPDANGRPKISAEEAVKLYLERGDAIFDVGFFQRLRSGGGVLDEKYSAAELEKALAETFGTTTLNDLIKPCIVTAYDVQNAKPHYFKKRKAGNEIFNFHVKDIARATSAAPTYFEAALVKNMIGTPFALIDGGVFVNNPALAAYSEVRNTAFDGIDGKIGAKNMCIVSIGTGSESKQHDYQKLKDWGPVKWIKPLIDIMMTGNAQNVHYHLKSIYGTLTEEQSKDYHRIEPRVITAKPDMDDASKENMEKLKNDALNYVSEAQNDQELDAIVEKLIKYGPEDVVV